MEYLLHYVWQHRLYGTTLLRTEKGEPIEVLDPGVHNLSNSGPDFFNAKLKIGGQTWAGNVEVHLRSSDWYRHHHEADAAYNNVVLHVVETIDDEVRTLDGKLLPQVALSIPADLRANYEELRAEETYPPCYRVIPHVPSIVSRAWMSRLAVERLEEKIRRVDNYLQRTGGDWERVFFITLARNFGFGTNAQAFEQWAFGIEPSQVGKHRDNPFQVEAFFLGQAGLLDDDAVKPERRDDYFRSLQTEYAFLRSKFNLEPMARNVWKFGRLRPQNFPFVRLVQLARLYSTQKINLSGLLETESVKAFHGLFRIGVEGYWRNHYAFGEPSAEGDKTLGERSLDLLVINTAAPLLFAYGRHRLDEEMAGRAFNLLEEIAPEHNYVTRSWARAGIKAANAADSQALLHLRTTYCDRKDCLRCRFGAEYLRSPRG